jgi:glycine C-acetyltransferase/8-amino-7-oxononanoate synthase
MDGPERAKSLYSYLEGNGIIAPFMNYPVMQELNMIRIAVSISHTDDQIGSLLELLKKWKEK